MQNKYLTFYYMKLNILILILIIGMLTYFLCKNKENFDATTTIEPKCKGNKETYELKMYYTDWCADCRKALIEFNNLDNLEGSDDCIELDITTKDTIRLKITGYNNRKRIAKKLIICDSANLTEECNNVNKYPKIILTRVYTNLEPIPNTQKEYTGVVTTEKIMDWLKINAI